MSAVDPHRSRFVQGMARLLEVTAPLHEGHGEWHGITEHVCADGTVSREISPDGVAGLRCGRCGTAYCVSCDSGPGVAVVAIVPSRNILAENDLLRN